ncbi:flagellum-specific peptidoglycan hydrolase FlgJ [Neolewinella xylanilytica]|uniref:Peptidoglycan hydrolase n=1 Tax=Neolewinella xylanilytica TaxID=1514080 RepID=A0A2S6I3H8_9BACT|nr:glucosaminidase domain-containing protein [Neolewinella xylanilytica]PPK85713.1 flagellum-specific peptidoglycan hydrolase FlgJ [Neolewinella xylanilytica]
MKPFVCALLCLITASSLSANLPFTWTAEENSEQEAYIERFKRIAMEEMERTGVPASIKLAQGILESNSGKSYLARTAKNHFGIKCGSNWKGDAVYREDDDYDSSGRLTKSCFRRYNDADASYVAHSEFLRDPNKAFRYGFLFRLEPTDYKGWAKGLRKAGYATNPRYPELLITLIERHRLDEYDVPGEIDPIDLEVPVEDAITGILNTNDVNYYVSQAPVNLQQVAQQVDVSVRRLLDYNEKLVSENQTVAANERIYLQKKRRSYRGSERYHTVMAGEDLYDIAQRYGIRVKNLARRNRLGEQARPAAGEQVKLRGWRVRNPPDLTRNGATPDPVNPITRPDRTIEPATTDDDGFLDMGAPISPNTPIPEPKPRPTVEPEQPVVTPPATTPPTSPNQPATVYHAVTAGETLYAISRRYGVTVDAIRQLNALTGNTISVGQQLRIR